MRAVPYLDQLKEAIRVTHGCAASHIDTAGVEEIFQGQTVWKGTVEIFKVSGHPKAQRAYAWGNANEKGGWDITTVLEIPPVVSAQTAVKVAIASYARQATARQSGKP